MQSIIETIRMRRSCRTYSNKPLEAQKLEAMREFLKSNTVGPFGNPVRYQLTALNDLEAAEIKNLGTYGVIKGARHYLIGAVRKGNRSMEDFGYSMERNILLATQLGLGTCWLGGTFNKAGFAGRMNLGEEELLPAVSPLGYASDKRSLTDRFFRFSASSDKRKAWQEIFFSEGMRDALTEGGAGPYATPLECVRIGPSASNKQPWRLIKNREGFHFYLKRTPGYNAVFGEIQIQNIDMGIAMCHFELSARELGLQGLWRQEAPQIPGSDMAYIASWVCREAADETELPGRKETES